MSNEDRNDTIGCVALAIMLIVIAYCAVTLPAEKVCPPDPATPVGERYWRDKICVQPRYRHLAECQPQSGAKP